MPRQVVFGNVQNDSAVGFVGKALNELAGGQALVGTQSERPHHVLHQTNRKDPEWIIGRGDFHGSIGGRGFRFCLLCWWTKLGLHARHGLEGVSFGILIRE